MMQLNLSSTGSAVANHLWQSTLFLLCATLLALALRRNSARIRFLVWFAASVKFLIPFSGLTAFGSRLASLNHPAEAPELYYVFQKVSRPFGQGVAPGHFSWLLPWLFPILALAWGTGFAVVAVFRCLRWKHVARIHRSATPVSQGREVETLRRIEGFTGTRRTIPICLSGDSLEPGVFGILRPALLWPEKISLHLGDAHLEAVLAHEVEHVRRWDNLTAAIHMLVEAIFWFHPLVWWLGARMVEERERACDESVLEHGSAPQIYAESILTICRLSLGSPLTCVSGVTGGELRQRIVRIMSPLAVSRLGVTKRVALAAIGMGAIVGPVVTGVVRTPSVNAQTSSASPAIPPASAVAIPVPGKSLHGSQIYRVGGPVTAPKLTDAPDPEYTEKARKARFEGVCVIELFIDGEGKPQHVKVVRRLGMGLDRKAVEAVKKYTFTPAILDGKPVPVQANIEVNFRIH